MSGKKQCNKLKNCSICKTEFEGHYNRHTCDKCSAEKLHKCKNCGDTLTGQEKCLRCEIEKSHKKYTAANQEEWIECNICGFRAKEISIHIIGRHNVKPSDYGITKCEKARKRVSGENNPGFNHGGRLSPWSNKSKHHTAEEIVAAKALAKENSIVPEKMHTRIEYWIKQGYSEEDAKLKVSERQTTFSLEKCIKKYGEEEGRKRWVARQEKWKKTLTSKNAEEIQRINRLKVGSKYSISKAEREIVLFLKENGFDVTDQFQLSKENKKHYIYDIQYKNRIIEYNGDFWHCNPNIWEDLDYNKRIKMTAKEKWDKDLVKNEFAKDNGFEVLVIWESEYKQNKKETLNKCLNFLTQ